MQIQRVGVLGCGLMGHGIAQVTAQAGCDVVVREIDPDVLERGSAGSRSSSIARSRRASSSARKPMPRAAASTARSTTASWPTATS
jgi:3-hydroxyacyl-CoA dehydrogenase